MSEPERARPQYGEYATPEEQRAAIRVPAPGAGDGSEPGSASVSGSASAGRTPPAADASPARRHGASGDRHLPPPRPTTSAARPSRTADRVITLILLAYGLVTVASAIPQLWHLAAFAGSWMDLAGIDGTFTNTAQGDLWGRIGVGVFVVGWLVTAALSVRAIARGKLAWWIPLVGAIVTFIVVSVCLTVPLVGDPAIVAHFGA